MREIEFRGKSKRTGEWVYGTGVVQIEENTYDTNKWEIVQNVNYDELDYCIPSYETEEIDTNTLGQYTGLKDKNGKKIFEGDIVDVTRPCIWEIGIVIFKDGCFFIKVKETLLPLYECEINNYKLEVIGNIYDNPELLKEEI